MNTNLPPKLLQTQLKHLSVAPPGFKASMGIKRKPLMRRPVATPSTNETQPLDVDAQAPAATPLPEQLPPQVHNELPAKPRPAGIQPQAESLPVLEAFQQFLDAERKRARSRMVTLTIVLVVVFVLVAAISLSVALIYTKQFRKDFSDMKDQVANYHENAQQINSDTKTALQNFETEASKLKGDVQSVTEIAADFKSRAEDHDATLAKLQNTIKTLETQNDSMRTDLARLRNDWPAVSTTVESLQAEVEKLRYQTIQKKTAQPRSATPRETPTAIAMSLVPRGATNAVTWRVPLPE